MLYQLPNGKTVYLTFEQFLDLTDQDVQELLSLNFGENISNPWHGSQISSKTHSKEKYDDDILPEEEISEQQIEQDSSFLDDPENFNFDDFVEE